MPIAPTASLTVVQPSVTLADPHVLSDIRDRRSIIDSIYDSLVRRRDDGGFSPWLALDWQVHDGCRHWRFTLREQVHCHDGSLLSAEDVVASLQRALSPELPGELGTQGVLRSYLQGAEIFVADAHTVAIDSPLPVADLLDLLVDIPVVPRHALAGLPSGAIGSGPYQLESVEAGRLTLRAFASHWAGCPPAERLHWLAEPDALHRLQLLSDGQADLVVEPDRRLSASDTPGLLSAPAYLCVIFLFNLQQGPCQDLRVRQALSHAIDLDAIIADQQIAAGAAQPLAGPLAPRHAAAAPALLPYAYDPERARSLLHAAGFADGLTLDIDLPARFPDESIALAQRIAGYFAAVGVQANLHVHHDRPAYAEMIRSKKFGDLCCFDSSPASSWRVFSEKLDERRQGPWWQGYRSAALNQLLDQAASQADAARRARLLQAAYRQVHQDVPWLFLYAPESRWLLGPRAQGWQASPEGRVRIIATR